MQKYGALLDAAHQFMALAEKVYGPYPRSDGREIVIVIDDAGKKKTKTWARHLMEKHLGRELDPELETVDHRDSNFLNNDINNLQLLPRNEHSRQDTRRVKNIKLKCALCNKDFERSPRLLRDKHNKGATGIFCSRSCSGRYNRLVQLKQMDKLPVQDYVASEYYKAKDTKALADYLLVKYAKPKPAPRKYAELLHDKIVGMIQKYDWFAGYSAVKEAAIGGSTFNIKAFTNDKSGPYIAYATIVITGRDLHVDITTEPNFPQSGLDVIEQAKKEVYYEWYHKQ